MMGSGQKASRGLSEPGVVVAKLREAFVPFVMSQRQDFQSVKAGKDALLTLTGSLETQIARKHTKCAQEEAFGL